MVQALAVLQFQLAADHLEAGIVHRVGHGVAVVDVRCRQRANHGPGGILRHRRCRQRDIARHLVDVGYREREGFGPAQAAAVCRRHVDSDAGRGLVVQALAALQLQLAIHDFKAGVVHRVADAVSGIDIRRRKRSDHGARTAFRDRVRRQGDIRWCLVDISDRDRKGFRAGQTAGVSCRHRDGNLGRALLIQALAVLQFQLSVHDLEACIVHRVAHTVIRISICCRQCADHSAGSIFRNGTCGQGNVGRRFVDVRHREGKGLSPAQAATVSCRHIDGDAAIRLVVEDLIVLQLQLAIDNFETSIVDRVFDAIAIIRRAECSDDGAGRILRDGLRGQGDIRRCVIDVLLAASCGYPVDEIRQAIESQRTEGARHGIEQGTETCVGGPGRLRRCIQAQGFRAICRGQLPPVNGLGCHTSGLGSAALPSATAARCGIVLIGRRFISRPASGRRKRTQSFQAQILSTRQCARQWVEADLRVAVLIELDDGLRGLRGRFAIAFGEDFDLNSQ